MLTKPDPYRKYIRAIKRGDPKAFERIYADFWESLFAVGYNRINNSRVVEDIVQEIFCELWRRRKTIDVKVSLHTYLHASLKYKVIDYYRSARYTRELTGRQTYDLAAENNTEHTVGFNELYHMLKEGIENLPSRCKLVFKLSQVEMKSSKEIAELLGVSARTVETQIYKSRKILKHQLSDYLPLTVWFLLFL